MTQIIEPKPIYRTLTEEDVRKALNDPDETNPIAIEIARLLTGYMTNFQALVERLGYIPPHVLRTTPRLSFSEVDRTVFRSAPHGGMEGIAGTVPVRI